ncbi:hypothetical protein L209DRAFT_750127, partial [Thermothelomyces heterothallicus CBS 203.75]
MDIIDNATGAKLSDNDMCNHQHTSSVTRNVRGDVSNSGAAATATPWSVSHNGTVSITVNNYFPPHRSIYHPNPSQAAPITAFPQGPPRQQIVLCGLETPSPELVDHCIQLDAVEGQRAQRVVTTPQPVSHSIGIEYNGNGEGRITGPKQQECDQQSNDHCESDDRFNRIAAHRTADRVAQQHKTACVKKEESGSRKRRRRNRSPDRKADRKDSDNRRERGPDRQGPKTTSSPSRKNKREKSPRTQCQPSHRRRNNETSLGARRRAVL